MSVWLLLADTVVDVIYARGALNRSDVEFVVTVQRWFLLQMPFYAVGVVCWRLLNTLAHWHTLFLASVLALAVDVGLAMALAEPMRTPGIAVAYVAAIAVWCTTLLLTLRGRLKRLA